MISGHKIGSRQVDYYLEYVRRGGPSRWVGQGAAELGLVGAVAPEAFAALACGVRPDGSRLLERVPPDRTPGWDFTFSAPKSVSVCWALADAELRAKLEAAHDAAVDAAVEFLQRQGGRARRGRAGRDGHVEAGLAVACFTHPASRESDPQMHTHAIITNVGHGLDRRWTALDSRLLYAHRAAAGAIYRSELRERVAALGGVWGVPDRRGLSELEGVDEAITRAFSRRREQIEAALAGHGTFGRRASQAACLATRREKLNVELGELATEWGQRAATLGWDARRVGGLLDLTDRRSEPGAGFVAEVEARLLGPTGLTREAAAFRRDDVICAWANAMAQGASSEAVQGLADRTLARPNVVALVVADSLGNPLTAENRGRKGVIRLVRARAGQGGLVAERRFSTTEMLGLEASILSAARSTWSGRACLVPLVDAVLHDGGLSEEQAHMVRSICTSDKAVDVVVGVPGSGKTFGLGAARRIWARSGFRVTGTALAAEAAAQLQAGSGIASGTLDSLLNELAAGRSELSSRTVIVVDEAGMVDTRRMARLLRAAHQAGAKVVLSGDDRQLPAVEAGGMFAALARRPDTIRLVDNARQVNEWEREAVADLRHGRAGEAAGAYRRAGRVHAAADPGVLLRSMVARWWAARTAGEEVALFAYSREAARLLNRLARQQLGEAGLIGTDSLALRDHPALDLAGRDYSVGDEIVCLRNRRRLGDARDPSGVGVRNGTRAVVTAICPDTGEVSIRDSEGRQLRLPTDYVVAHTDYGYALTLHKGQGRTVGQSLLADQTDERRPGRSFVFGAEGFANEAALVAASRATDSTEFFVLRDDDSPDLDLLAKPWSRSEAKAPAHVELEAQQSIATLAETDGPSLLNRQRRLAAEVGHGPHWDPAGEAEAARQQIGLLALESEQRKDQHPETVDDQPAESLAAGWEGLDGQIQYVMSAAEAADAALARHRARKAADPDLRASWAELEVVESALATRRYRHLADVAAQPPDYVTALLGAPPPEPGRLSRWRQGMIEIEDYRRRRDYVAADGPAGPLRMALGEPSADYWESRQYRRTAASLAAVRRDLELGPPLPTAVGSEPGPTESSVMARSGRAAWKRPSEPPTAQRRRHR